MGTVERTQLKAGPLAKFVAHMLLLEDSHSLLHIPITKKLEASSNLARKAGLNSHEGNRSSHLRMCEDLQVCQK